MVRICLLYAVACLGTIKFGEIFFPSLCCAASVSVLNGWLLFMQSSVIELLVLRESTKRRGLLFGFLCANKRLTYLLKGSVVLMAY